MSDTSTNSNAALAPAIGRALSAIARKSVQPAAQMSEASAPAAEIPSGGAATVCAKSCACAM